MEIKKGEPLKVIAYMISCAQQKQTINPFEWIIEPDLESKVNLRFGSYSSQQKELFKRELIDLLTKDIKWGELYNQVYQEVFKI